MVNQGAKMSGSIDDIVLGDDIYFEDSEGRIRKIQRFSPYQYGRTSKHLNFDYLSQILAHHIRNPITTVGGLVRRSISKNAFSDGSNAHDIIRYVNDIENIVIDLNLLFDSYDHGSSGPCCSDVHEHLSKINDHVARISGIVGNFTLPERYSKPIGSYLSQIGHTLDIFGHYGVTPVDFDALSKVLITVNNNQHKKDDEAVKTLDVLYSMLERKAAVVEDGVISCEGTWGNYLLRPVVNGIYLLSTPDCDYVLDEGRLYDMDSFITKSYDHMYHPEAKHFINGMLRLRSADKDASYGMMEILPEGMLLPVEYVSQDGSSHTDYIKILPLRSSYGCVTCGSINGTESSINVFDDRTPRKPFDVVAAIAMNKGYGDGRKVGKLVRADPSISDKLLYNI